MARDQATLTVAHDEWTQLTNGDVTNITFQVINGPVFIRFTTDATQPAASATGILYRTGEGELNRALSDLTNLSGADRVWARGATGAVATVYVDHA